MPEVTITIGGRNFEVACQDGEENFLISAARMLDDEAQVLSDQIGRMPESRMLLMAGLMLADKTAAIEDRVREIETKLAERDAQIDSMRDGPMPEAERIEVPVIPEEVTDLMAEMAARTEAMAAALEEKLAE